MQNTTSLPGSRKERKKMKCARKQRHVARIKKSHLSSFYRTNEAEEGSKIICVHLVLTSSITFSSPFFNFTRCNAEPQGGEGMKKRRLWFQCCQTIVFVLLLLFCKLPFFLCKHLDGRETFDAFCWTMPLAYLASELCARSSSTKWTIMLRTGVKSWWGRYILLRLFSGHKKRSTFLSWDLFCKRASI